MQGMTVKPIPQLKCSLGQTGSSFSLFYYISTQFTRQNYSDYFINGTKKIIIAAIAKTQKENMFGQQLQSS